MPLSRRLIFSLKYLRRPRWDTGVVPPEVANFIATYPASRALDLGCGTGTSSLALAKAGWSVSGVDFTPRAIRLAKRKARKAKLSVDFHVGDVTHLPSLLFSSPYSLVLDVGCFHGLSPVDKTAYLNQLVRLLAPDGMWMLYSFLKTDSGTGPGMTESDLENITKQLELLRREDGNERNILPSAWFWFQKDEG